MKNQYFGDIHDYIKYGLLRAILGSGNLSLLVAWMLTPNDSGKDGGKRSYLQQPDRWRHYDESLFDFLLASLGPGVEPEVDIIESSSILPRTKYFSDIVPDGRDARAIWADRLFQVASGVDLVFLDPDNGFEVPSKPIGRKNSCKYIAWQEVQKLWNAGHSLLVFQCKKRERTQITIDRLASKLHNLAGSSFIEAFDAPGVLYFLAAQPEHWGVINSGIIGNLSRWQGIIRVVGLAGRHNNLFRK